MTKPTKNEKQNNKTRLRNLRENRDARIEKASLVRLQSDCSVFYVERKASKDGAKSFGRLWNQMKGKLITLSILLLTCAASAETITAYCACAKCCGKNAKGITAAGTRPVEGRTVAAARSIPLGTRIHIEGLGWRTVEDRTAKRFDGRVDVYFRSHAEALKFGKRKLQMTIQRINNETKQ